MTVLPNWHRNGSLREFAITVELSSLLEWPQAAETLVQTLDIDQPSDETYLLVPTRIHRAVPRLALKKISECWPLPDVGPWAGELGEPHSSRTFDAFTSAHKALQAISGVEHLPAQQQGHEVVRATSAAAVDCFNSARNEIAECPQGPVRDALLEALDDLAGQVETERDGRASGSSLAERITDGLAIGDVSQDLAALQIAGLIAQEWDIDPHAADDLLRELLG